jgi:hypothetical protein
MGSPDSVLGRGLPDQDEVSVGKALELGSRDDNDKDDCSCRTDMTTVRASNVQRCTTQVRKGCQEERVSPKSDATFDYIWESFSFDVRGSPSCCWCDYMFRHVP